jgi:hypothetical protein
MKTNGGGIRRVIVCLGLAFLGLVVSLKGDISHMDFHTLVANPILILVLGIGLSYLGFGPFSDKNNPTAGASVAVVGLLFRLAGSLLLVWAVFLWLFVISMTR